MCSNFSGQSDDLPINSNSVSNIKYTSCCLVIKLNWKQAGAELCQAQEKLGLANKLIWSSTSKQIEVVFNFSKLRVVF